MLEHMTTSNQTSSTSTQASSMSSKVQVPWPQVQVQVLKICTGVLLEYKYKFQVLHHWCIGALSNQQMYCQDKMKKQF